MLSDPGFRPARGFVLGNVSRATQPNIDLLWQASCREIKRPELEVDYPYHVVSVLRMHGAIRTLLLTPLFILFNL